MKKETLNYLKKPKKNCTFYLDLDVLKELEEYFAQNNIKNKSLFINNLIKMFLKDAKGGNVLCE